MILWQASDADTVTIPPHVRAHLIDPGSTTAYFKQIAQSLQVTVCYQGITTKIDPDLKHYMHVDDNDALFLRQVLICGDQQPFMFAHCLMTTSMYQQHQSWLDNLGDRPIGEVLFKRPELQRSTIDIAHLAEGSSYHQSINQIMSIAPSSLWIRRSKLFDATLCIGLTEVFLPRLLQQLRSEKSL